MATINPQGGQTGSEARMADPLTFFNVPIKSLRGLYAVTLRSIVSYNKEENNLNSRKLVVFGIFSFFFR